MFWPVIQVRFISLWTCKTRPVSLSGRGRETGRGFTVRRQATEGSAIKIALVPAHAEYHLRDVAGDFNLRTGLLCYIWGSPGYEHCEQQHTEHAHDSDTEKPAEYVPASAGDAEHAVYIRCDLTVKVLLTRKDFPVAVMTPHPVREVCFRNYHSGYRASCS